MSRSETGNRAGRHAVVIGAGITGLIVARVLSDHFVRVTLLERDELPGAIAPRKWVPQGQHAHLIPDRAQLVLERLFPGLLAQMEKDGSMPVDIGAQMHWEHLDVVSVRARSGQMSRCQSRYAVEWHIARQLRTLDNICILHHAQVTGLRTDCTGEIVSGVEFQSLRDEGAPPRVLTADLVVDAGGRGSALPHWLQALGFDSPTQTEIGVDVAYATRLYRRPTGLRTDWKVYVCQRSPASGARSVRIVPIENNCWMVTAAGRMDDLPPVQEGEFERFVNSVVSREAWCALLSAEPLGCVVATRFGASQRRHYEKLKRFPGRLIVLGDALCSVNPLSGHSVGLSTLQALALDRCMRRFGTKVDRVAQQMRQDAGRTINAAWTWAVYEDLRYTHTAGDRPPLTRVVNVYVSKLRALSAYDAEAARALLEVWQMQMHPLRLLRPALVWKVLCAALRPRRPLPRLTPGETSRAGA